MENVIKQYTCRLYQETDFQRLSEIHDAARRDELSFSNQEEAFIPFVEAVKNENFFEYRIVVAEKESCVDGFVAFHPDELGWLYVDPTKYRSGIAALLTQYVIEKGNTEICLEVLEMNEPAIRLYQKLGFEIVGKDTGQMPGNELHQVTVLEMKYCKYH